MTGEPSHLELGVPDLAAAQTFYGTLLGWQAPEQGPTQFATSTLPIGLHGGDPSAIFEVFFTVADLSASLEQVIALGGQVLDDVHDSPGFGRWAECMDDQGARFGLRTG